MFFVFLLLWIILNGRVTVEIVAFGVVFAAVFYWFTCKYLGRTVEDEIKWFRRIPRMLHYICVLIFEIIKANYDVTKLILSPSQEVEPQLIHIRTDLKSDGMRTLLANSITLTPGTITVQLKGQDLQVHCLDSSLAEGVGDSNFVRLLHEMEEKEL